MGSTQNFFEKKKEWSKKKDRILSTYLKPYLAKVAITKKPLIFIDCFAGKGKFDDGEIGSPLIIKNACDNYVKNYSAIDVKLIFIEKKYGADLKQNVSGHNVLVWEDSFENKVEDICKNISEKNVFLYVDPYGIKSLKYKVFEKIKDCKYNSLELLMNFSSLGFLREACRLTKQDEDKVTSDNDSSDYMYESDVENPEYLSEIANGNYWKKIIDEFRKTKDLGLAEERFATEYTKQLKALFKYVVNIPIKTNTNNIPKYRMVFGTNRDDGLFLMVDNMYKTWKSILEEENGNQIILFDYVKPDSKLIEGNLYHDIVDEIKKHDHFVDMREIACKLINKYGISYPISEYKGIIEKLECDNIIEIRRTPELTPTGKKSAFYSFDKKKVEVKIK